MRRRILCDLEQGFEHIYPKFNLRIFIAVQKLTADDVFEVVDRPIFFVHVVQSRDLYEPANVVGEEFVVYDPSRKLVPLVFPPSIDAQTPFTVLFITCLCLIYKVET